MSAPPDPLDFPSEPRPGFFRRLLRSKILRRTFYVLLGLVLFVVCSTLLSDWMARRDWEAYQAKAQAQGFKLDLADYLGAPVTDEENFAVNSVFQNAILRADGQSVSQPKIGDWLRPLPGRTNALLIGAGGVEKGERVKLDKWRDFLIACGHLTTAGESPAADILLVLSKAEHEIQVLRAAAERPACRFPVRWEDGIATAQPHLNEMMGASKHLCLKVTAHLALGQNDQALADMKLLFRLETSLQYELTLLSGLVRTTMIRQLHSALWDGLAGRQWRDADLQAIQAELAKDNILEALHFSLGSERAWMNSVTESMMKMDGKERSKLFQPMGGGSDYSVLFSLLPKSYFYHNKIKANEYFDALLTRVDRERGQRGSGTAPEDMIASLRKNPVTRVYYSLFNVSVPAIEGIETKFLYVHTRQQQAMVACALERHRLTRRVFPGRLEELTPEFLEALPHDVIDGQIMRYRLENDGGYKLWGTGKNKPGQSNSTSLDQQTEWVWIMPGEAKR